MDTGINQVAAMARYKVYQPVKKGMLQRSFFLLVLLLAISVNLFGQTVIWSDDFETDKDWTLGGEFERGTPQGWGGAYGNPDPSSAYQGSYVLGTDLTGIGTYDGDYEVNLADRQYYAISPVINCSSYSGVILQFQRWLNVESSTYDHAYIDISTNVGSTWNNVWANTATTITDNAWSSVAIDISAYADNSSTVQIRFAIGITDDSWQYSGWNIDDLRVIGFTPLAGDYRSRQTGDWNNSGTWQYFNGSSWVNASNYPGQNAGTGNVYILIGHTVSFNTTPTNPIGNLILLGSLTHSGNASRSLTISNDLSILSGTLNLSTSNTRVTTFYIGGDFSMSGGAITETRESGAIVFNGSSTHTFIKTGGTISNTINFTVNSPSTLDMGTYILDGSSGTFTLNSGATLITGHPEGISSSGYVGSIQVTGTRTFSSGANYVYNGTSAQVTGTFTTTPTAATVNNLTINNASGVTLNNTLSVSNVLTLTAGAFKLGDYNLTVTNTSASAIQGSPFSAANMVESDGSGYLIRPANSTLPVVFPVGSEGYYTPVSISSLSETSGNISIRTETDNTLGSNYLPRVWEAITSTSVSGRTATVSFTYDAAESTITPNNVWVKPSAGTWQTPTGIQSFSSNTFTITGTTDITTTSTQWTADWEGTSTTYFSYQSGPWNDKNTWTTDPGGTTLINSAVPSDNDVVVILPNRTVTLSSDVDTVGLEVNINSGGILDMSTYRFTGGLKSLKGSGTLRLSSTSFPTTFYSNTFVEAGGGTTEYRNTSGFTFPASQATYNNLTINVSTGVVATQLSHITLNGNLLVKQGTYRINDDTQTTKLNLSIYGDVTVNSGAYIYVGKGHTNTTTDPTSISGGTAPFLNYYEQFHRVVINGNFTNNGTVRFTNLDHPQYDAFPPTTNGTTTGAASVYFQGTSNSKLLCGGITDFYNIILDKGTDQTYKLSVQPSAYGNFRIFGANIASATVSTPNPDLMKALWIRNGSLVFSGLAIIPSLTEGTTAGSEYYIPANGALILSGIDVIILNTADDAGEADVAYGVTGTTGVNTTGAAYQGMVVYGKLQVNDGYLSTRESAGLLYSSVNSGQFEINGGILDAKQFRTYDGSTSGAEYRQNGGIFILRGRFVRPVGYSSISSLSDTTGALSARAVNGTDDTYGTFNLEYEENIFSMSGGIIRAYDASGTAGQQKIVDVGSSLANSSVTGGTIEVRPQVGTVLSDASTLLVWSKESMYGNFTVNRGAGCSTEVRVRTNPLKILKNLTITSGYLRTTGQNISVGGNFTVSAAGTYNSNATTIFNGTKKQTFTIDGTINNGAAGLANIVVDRTVDTLKLAGTQASLTVQGTFDLNGGVFSDGGKTVYVAGNITNSGVHAGSGKIQLNGTAVQTIGGSGSGIFENLELNNSNTATAPVSLGVNTIINGKLTFANDKLFNISSYNLHLNSAAIIENAGASRYIQANGDAGDGGVTFDYPSATAILFPVGAPSTSHTAADYTPATIGFTTAPTTLGSITVVPVGYEHPATTVNGQSLTYFWRVKSSGFSGIAANSVTHIFQYSSSDVVGTEGNYIPALYNGTNYTWVKGTNANPPINTSTNTFTDWTTPGDSRSYIDADYTAGDNAFGTPTVYYSRINGTAAGSGLWSNTNTWSTDPILKHSGAAASTVPGGNDIVVIGGLDSIYLSSETPQFPVNDNNPVASYYQLNKAVASCASLQIEEGSVLDIQNNPGCNFGIVNSHSNGNGKIRITTRNTTFDDPSSFIFPNGDFSDFNVNEGVSEFYTINPQAGTYYILPSNTSSYGTVILTPLRGSNIILPNISNVTIYGDLICNGSDADAWLAMTWNGTYGTIVPKTISVKGDFLINGGSFVFIYNNNTAQSISIDGNVYVAPGAGLDVYSTTINNTMAIGGSLINNSDYSTAPKGTQSFVRLLNGTNKCNLTFFGSNSASITNTTSTPVTIFSNVTINKGTSQATTLTCDIGGTLTTPTDNWLTLQNGTFKYMRTDPSSPFTISTNTAFTIPATAGLYVDYSNGTNRNIEISNTNSKDESDLFLEGKLTIINGNVLIGNGTSVRNNDIEYAGGGASEIEIQGGYLRVNGQIRRNPSMAGGILKYTQTGGTVDILGLHPTTTNAKFEVCNATSVFNMSGGNLNIIRGGGGSTYGDFYLRPGSSTVTGGTITFNSQTLDGEPQTYRFDSNVPIYNLTITGRTATTVANAEVNLMVNPLVLKGNLLLSNSNSILKTNSIDVTIKGNLTNNGTVSSYVYGTNTTTFSGNTQRLDGSSVTNFYSLVVNPVTSVTLDNGNSVQVSNDLTINSGTLICGNYAVNLKGDLTNNAAYTDTQYGVILNGSVQQTVAGSGNFGRLELNNLYGAKTTSDIVLSKNLVLTNGVFSINDHLLSLLENSIIEGTGFGTSKMVSTNGVFSDEGISKVFGVVSGSTVDFTYPLGVSGKYTPIDVSITNNSTTGSIRITNVDAHHPAVIDPSRVLQYYWAVESTGLTSFTGSLLFNYLEDDVMGTEADYYAAKLTENAWGFPGTIDAVNNTLTYHFTGGNNLGDEYTAGDDEAFPDDIPVFTSKQDGPWSDPDTWEHTAGDPYTLTGGPNGFIVIVKDTVTLDENYCRAYRTTITGKLKVVKPYFGHNLGTVDGDGTLYLETATFPAGKYNSFLSCSNNSTLEYGGTTDYAIIADLYDEIANLRFTGSGTKTLPIKDLTICKLFEIDGPVVDNSVNNKKLTIKGEMIRTSGGFISGSGSGATVSFAGTSSQLVENFNGSNAFNNLEINNSQGLTLNSEIEITGNLHLTNGLINTTSSDILYISNLSTDCVTPTGGSSSSYVSGPLKKKLLGDDNNYFRFPVGNSSRVGNMLSLEYGHAGTLDWTVEYINPSSLNTYSSPLTAVNEAEYWNVGSSSGDASGAIVNIAWDPSSNLTPLMTENGISDMRVAEYNGSNWVELASEVTTGSDNYNGSAETADRVSIPSGGTRDYTLACVNMPKPRVRLAPAGPVCGNAGIPIELSSSYSITGTYSIGYTKDGVAQTPLAPTSFPATLPTDVNGGTYQLTSFTYEGGSKTGAVDITSVTVYAVPTTANAGNDQSTCGASSATLEGNTPALGTGTWSIVSGTGGSVAEPNNPTSTFSGVNGSTYTLRWTIANGTCTSTDDVVIAFPLLPEKPVAFVLYDDKVCQGDNDVDYSVVNNPSLTYYWNYLGTGGTIMGSGNAITVDYGTTATSGDISVYTHNGCGDSAPLTLAVTVNTLPVFTITGSSGDICDGDLFSLTTTFTSINTPYSINIIKDGSSVTGYPLSSSSTPSYVYNENLVWLGPSSGDSHSYSVTVVDNNGCTDSSTIPVTVDVWKIPETGPEYHIPNNYGM